MKSIETLKQSRGAVAPLVAIMLVLIVVCVALVVDLGHVHNVKVELQRAVDAAALAGAQQLNGSANQVANAKNVAIATAIANGATDGEIGFINDSACTTSATESCLGKWDKYALGSTASVRFTQTETSPNAILVRVRRNVPHAFFFFLPGGTDVTADAIAVNIFEAQTIPFVLVSCIQTDETYLKPGQTVCDINNFRWGSDPADTAGWTSLTFRPINPTAINDFFSQAGIELFNQVVYGTNTDHQGLENEDVSPGPIPFNIANYNQPFNTKSPPCNEQNIGNDIDCGLGETFSKISSPPTPNDPLLYGHSNTLPRWSDEVIDNTFDPNNDYFTRVWSMDGVLLRGAVESLTSFENRMQSLKEASDSNDYTIYETNYGPLKAEFKADSRFSSFIGKGSLPLKESDGKTGSVNSNFAPLYEEVLRYAGYPLVEVANGEMVSALKDFLEGNQKGIDPIVDTVTNEFLPSVLSDYKPFDDDGSLASYGKGKTILLTLPVIFTGVCDTNKFNKGMPYIGLSNVLVTRIWKNPNDGYDAGDSAVTVIGTPPSCTFDDFNPPYPPTSSGKFVFVKGKKAALEGILLPPTMFDTTEAGIRKIHLVE